MSAGFLVYFRFGLTAATVLVPVAAVVPAVTVAAAVVVVVVAVVVVVVVVVARVAVPAKECLRKTIPSRFRNM